MSQAKAKKKAKKQYNKIQPKNAEQELAIKAGRDFILNGNPDEWMTIVGKAGTGKTTVAIGILEPFIKRMSVLICALSHKAKLVLENKIKEAFGENINFVSKTVAGALAMKMDEETGDFTMEGESFRPIQRAKIIIVDEGSMINEKAHDLIMSEKRKNAIVIYFGDVRQLPPIRESNSEHRGKPSPVFYTENRVVLHERVRQGEESPILPFADYFGDASRLQYPPVNPVPDDNRTSIVSGVGALVFAKHADDIMESILPVFKKAIDTKDMNLIKFVSYRRETRTQINNIAREYLFGYEKSQQQFLPGDLLMFSDNYDIGLDDPISNSYEVQVIKSSPLKDSGYRCYDISFLYEGKEQSALTLDKRDIARFNADVAVKFAHAKTMVKGSDERKAALKEAWAFKRKYAPLEYAYAITSHKSQGSTYKAVVVDETDITSVTMITNKEKMQSMYTAITRASLVSIIIDGRKTDYDAIKQAVEML